MSRCLLRVLAFGLSKTCELPQYSYYSTDWQNTGKGVLDATSLIAQHSVL